MYSASSILEMLLDSLTIGGLFIRETNVVSPLIRSCSLFLHFYSFISIHITFPDPAGPMTSCACLPISLRVSLVLALYAREARAHASATLFYAFTLSPIFEFRVGFSIGFLYSFTYQDIVHQ